MQTLSLIRAENIQTSDSAIHIHIPDLIKTSGPKRVQPLLRVPFFPSDPRICAASALVEYMRRSSQLRPSTVQALFLTSTKPYRAATAQTLCRWTKEVLQECGLDISIFSAHSTRHASTSTARKSDVDLNVIFRAAGWTSQSSTFARFYDLPIAPDFSSFAESIYNRRS